MGDDIISLCRQRFPALRLFLIIRLHISRSTALPFHTESVWTSRHLVAVLYCTLSVLGEQPKSVPLLLRESVSDLLSKTTYSSNECPDIVFPAWECPSFVQLWEKVGRIKNINLSEMIISVILHPSDERG